MSELGNMVMFFKNISHFFKEAFKNIVRHPWMSLASILTIFVSLFLIGLFGLLMLNLEYIANQVESNVEIVVWMEPELESSKVEALGDDLEKLAGVASVRLVPKEEGLAQMEEYYGGEHDLLEALGGFNPLPDFYLVLADNPRNVPVIAEEITQFPLVEEVDYGQGEVERLFSAVDSIRSAGWAMVAVLILAAVTLVSMSIRVAVLSQQKEIEIMSYVGATSWFIRWPFILEGMIMGFFGSLIAIITLYFSYFYLVDYLKQGLSFVALISSNTVVLSFLSWFLLGGVLLGLIGSSFAVIRFLKV